VGYSAGLVALIVEDEEPVLDEVRKCVQSDARIGKILTANNALDALKILADQPVIDIAFLDVKMPGLDGIGLSKLISNTPEPPRIVFVTAHPAYVGDAFDLNAADYVLKPMRAERISEAISRATAKRDLNSPRQKMLRELQEVGATQRAAKQKEAERRAKRVFLSYSRDDASHVRELYVRLTGDRVSCWYDQDILLPGQNWRIEVSRAIRRCRFFLVCLSSQSVTGAGYRHAELRHAIDVASEQPEGSVFLVPIRLEPCQIPEQLSHLHAVDLFAPAGYHRLLKVLRQGRPSP